jgi:hypothetical protein
MPQFLTTDVYPLSSLWLSVLLRSLTSLAAITPGPPARHVVRFYDDVEPIALAKMAAPLAGLIWITQQRHQPTTVSLHTDSSVVCHSLVRGTGLNLRSHELFYIRWLVNKLDSGHGLLVRWIPSADNLADPPLSRNARTLKTGSTKWYKSDPSWGLGVRTPQHQCRMYTTHQKCYSFVEIIITMSLSPYTGHEIVM